MTLLYQGYDMCLIQTQMVITQQKQNICTTFVQRRPNDVGPTLYKCFTNLCVYWVFNYHNYMYVEQILNGLHT